MVINKNNTKIIKKATYEVKGEPIEITEKVRINMANNQEMIDEKLEDENLEKIYNQYRKKKAY